MNPVISLQHVNIYQAGILVLSDVTFQIEKSEFVYLVGKTGEGKSSLLKTLYGELKLVEGAGSVAAIDLKKLNAKTIPMLRRKLGIVFQDFQLLYEQDVKANLMFVLKATGWNDKRKMEARCAEVLDLVGLKTKNFKMPHELSGGEQQRVVIARALLNYPELILADEPTGNLDPDTSEEIVSMLLKICRDTHTAVLMATHDYMVIKKFESRMLKCEKGKVMDIPGSVSTAAKNAEPIPETSNPPVSTHSDDLNIQMPE